MIAKQFLGRRRNLMSVVNKTLVRRLYEEVWNKRQLQLISEIISPSHALQAPNVAGSAIGPDAYKRQVLRFLEGYPDLHWTIEDTIAEEDKVVACWSISGTQRGEYLGMPGSGAGKVQGLGYCTTAAPGARCPVSRHESRRLESQHARHPGGNRWILILPPEFLVARVFAALNSPAMTKRGTLRNFRSGPLQTHFTVRLTGLSGYSPTNIGLFLPGKLHGSAANINGHKSHTP